MRRQYSNGPSKQWVTIISVSVTNKQLQGELSSGGKIVISLFEIPPAFRWPIEGEIWSVDRDTNDQTQWLLGSRILNPTDQGIDQYPTGSIRMDSVQVWDSQGRKFVAVDITSVEDGQILVWDDTEHTFVIQTPPPIPPLGSMFDYAGTTDPDSSWVIANGRTLNAVSDATLVPLWTLIGTTYGGTGQSSFLLPNTIPKIIRIR